MDQFLKWLESKKDIFGSDIYVRYSSSYVWQANQMGHIFLGLFFTMLLNKTLGLCAEAALALSLVGYAMKETLDYLIAVRTTGKVFPVKKIEVFLDAVVDWFFWTFGSLLTFTLLVDYSHYYFTFTSMAAVTFAYFYFVREPYLNKKVAFDRSYLTYFSRLATFPTNRLPQDKKLITMIQTFAEGKGEVTQLVITGTENSGRTSLALSIGGEATNYEIKVRFLNGARFFNKTLSCETPAEKEQPWSIREADLVIIDELDPVLKDLEGQYQVNKFLDIVEEKQVFTRPLCGETSYGSMPKVVWVVNDTQLASLFLNALRDRYDNATIAEVTLEVNG